MLSSATKSLKRFVKPWFASIDLRLMALCEKFPYLANIYFCLDRSFEREHHAVVAGRRRYERSIQGASTASHVYRLRRNTHRLEKGLISRPLREVFALTYLQETIESFVTLYQDHPTEADDPLLQWSRSVLSEYFRATSQSNAPTLEECRHNYEQLIERLHPSTCEKKPQRRDTTPLSTSIEDMQKLAIRRRSVRWYDSTPVPRDVIDKAVEVAGLSPSACNRQPFKFRIFDDPKLVTKLASIPMGTRGFSHQFPVFIVIVGELHAYPFSRDRHVIYIDSSLAAMALEFALEVQGIATCSINWPDIPHLEKKIAEALNLSPDERVIMCMSAGYPDPEGLVPYSQKKTLDELRSYNQQ
ncbi:nitroreductase family protein [Adhaeretor mobilis]|uniref:Nitroreductase family protein n=1 Tax=Adhaeretor mobilis TaxID=1930276 RepID=A0A517MYU9_9BACT|nr:nitroreductase family protein [Adhaeretor mobilis]QDS99987.1 Nitroreductase family protein [Adhaeretor mobilis]